MKAKRKRVVCQDRESSNALISANAGALLTSDVLLAEKLHSGCMSNVDIFLTGPASGIRAGNVSSTKQSALWMTI